MYCLFWICSGNYSCVVGFVNNTIEREFHGGNKLIKGQMTGWRFQTRKELERARNWLVERGLLAHIDYEKMEVVVSGTVNGKWVTDSNGDLIRID